MGRVRRTLAMVGLLFCFTACDPGGRVYEDLRLAQLKVGESTEADVRRIFGPPDTVLTPALVDEVFHVTARVAIEVDTGARAMTFHPRQSAG